jgi:preprotein translocase subunit SecF
MQIKFPRKYDFMGQKAFIAAFVGGGLLFALAAVAVFGVQRGVEFTGGAEVALRYIDAPDLATVRQTLDAAKLPGVSVTTFGDTGGRELAIRVGLPQAGVQAGDKDLATQVVDALKPAEVRQKIDAGMIDLNTADSVTIADRLVAEAGMVRAEADAAADAILALRRDGSGVLPGLDQVRALPAVPEAAKGWLAQRAFIGPFGLRGQEVIEASISREMRDRAIIASIGALVLMMLYLWIRFSGFKWGLAAMVALAFDVVLTLGLFALFKEEFTLPVVAAFLTLIGYSVNDKVVVFDRIREVTRARGTAHMERIINDSLNEVLSRTLITGVCTVVASGSLYFFGGVVLRGFAFVLLMGIIVGTYSSIYVACPFLLYWQRAVARRVAAADRKVEHRKA